MTVFLINHKDIEQLNSYMGFLRDLPQYVESFKIVLNLVPENEYGQYKEPVLDHVIPKAVAGSTFWSKNLNPLRELHQDINQYIKDLTDFFSNVSSYIAGLDRQERRKSLTQEDHARALYALGDPLKLTLANSFLDILSLFRIVILGYAKTFQNNGNKTSDMLMNAYTITPRVMDFMSTTIDRCSDTLPFPHTGSLLLVPWARQRPMARESDLEQAKKRLQLTEKLHIDHTSAASNMSTYCYRLEQLLRDSQSLLTSINEHSNLADLSLTLKIVSVRLKELRNLSGEMTILLQYSY